MQKEYLIVGMMSGTSLDGVDLAACRFVFDSKWIYTLVAAQTIPYPLEIIESIKHMQNEELPFLKFKKEQIKYSQFLAHIIRQFIERNSLTGVDYISVHGHTIYHTPKDQITVQATNINTLAGKLELDVIGNFRQLDVMRGGEGAPLAPFGQELFEGEIFINFGGIANVGYAGQGWDIHYCNLFFNKYSLELQGKEFDQSGNIGRKGQVNYVFIDWLRQNFQNQQHLSLQREGFQVFIQAIQAKFAISGVDIVATYYHFLAEKINKSVQEIIQKKQKKQEQKLKVICTGGGAKNTYLIQLLQQQLHDNFQYIIPDQKIVDFKQAIIFAYLGLKFIENIPNCSKGIGGTLIKGKISHLPGFSTQH